MSRWTDMDLAEALARNACLRIAPESRPQARQRVDLQTDPAIRSGPQPSTEPPARKKYGNVPVELDGVKYDSGKEARRHQELLILEREGEIADLKLKPKYVFEHNGVRIGSFTPDFSYVEGGKIVIEDVKGIDRKTGKKPTSTEGYRLRKRLLLAFYGLEVRET